MPADLRVSSELQACRELMRGGSKSFFAASLLLPQRVRAPATALYAFCRVADDAVDLSGDPHAAMAELRTRLDGVYAGTPAPIAADRALACTVHRYGLPRVLLDALLEGFLWDADGRRYQTIADVEDYGARVAGTVGAAMALIMGVRSPQALARACELGVAMQFTNIARDVGEDARNGRLYLPRDWLAEAGLDVDAWLQNPVHCPEVAQTVRRLLRAADELYERSEHGIAALPRDCRPAIRAARLVYAEIGRMLERQGLDSVNHRVVVPARRKAALMARAASAAFNTPGRAYISMPPLPAIQYLVDASVAAPAPTVAHRPAQRSFDERIGWVIELMERQAARRGV
ncbi:MAG: phytoene/squalene synthase family protein [Rubrivivax sp.]